MDKLKLYIFQAPRKVEVNWEYKPPGRSTWLDYRRHGYYHPDVEIYIAKAGCIRRLNHDLVAYHIMLALQDAHMPVNALRHDRAERKSSTKEKVSPRQPPLFPHE
jgi:hypothetical protein